jgi:hypothetical protein
MNVTAQIAKQFRDLHFGGNWTAVNMKDTLTGVSWQQATSQVYTFNTIAKLVYHINYYVGAVTNVLQGQPINAKDKFSFDVPPIQSTQDWEKLLDKTWKDAERFAGLVEQLPETKLGETFVDPKYGNYYRNLHGVIEHTHYHLGQIVLIKKIVAHEQSDAGT